MKVCEVCSKEIDTKDGENLCPDCEETVSMGGRVAESVRRNRRERAEAMESLGLVKVRGALGGTYWE